jgi:putative ATP-binding cassette transporter
MQYNSDKDVFFRAAQKNPRVFCCLTIEGKDTIEIQNLVLKNPSNPAQILLSFKSCTLQAGDRLNLSGASGSGKSSLLRALHGLWSFEGSGSVTMPDVKKMFIPQSDYVCDLNLMGIICAPENPSAYDDRQVEEALRLAGLESLIPDLHNEDKKGDDWNILSSGQKKRLAFASAFLQRPAVLLIDDASGALDEAAAHSLYSQLYQSLSQSIIVCVTNDKNLAPLHTMFASVGKEGDILCSRSPEKPAPVLPVKNPSRYS